MEYGEIVKVDNQLGTLIRGKEKEIRFLPLPTNKKYGYIYNIEWCKIVTEEDVKETTKEEKIKYLGKDFSWGIIKEVHSIGEYLIFEYLNKNDNEISFHVYINFKDTNASYNTLDEAIIGAIAYKKEGLNSHAATYICKMLNIKKD